MAKENGRPGVIIYFDISPCLNRLSDPQNGKLFKAILEYGQFGVAPEFGDDLGLSIAWDFIRPMIDRDNERYKNTSKQRAEAANKRWEAYRANSAQSMQMDANASFAMQTMPTPTPTATPTPTTTATTEIKKKEEKELSMQERKEQMIRQLKAYQE